MEELFPCALPNSEKYNTRVNSHIIRSMLRVAEKLLVVLLTLLILLSHVQGATAGMTPPSDQNDGLHQLAYNADGDWLMSAAALAQACEQLWRRPVVRTELSVELLSCTLHCTPFAFPPAVLTTAPAWL